MTAKQITSAWYLDYKNSEPWAYINDAFTVEECDQIKLLGDALDTMPSMITGNNDELREIQDEATRKGTVAFFNSSAPDAAWLYRKLTDAILSVNRQFWNFDLDYIETLQYTMYLDQGDKYDTHADLAFKSLHFRKLSFTIQLDPADSYEGCDLEMLADKNYTAVTRAQGSITVFPSYMPHRVTPLRSGQRRSLVGWVCGPKFK
jgi:PKHD-type hydroxylase